MDFEQARDRSAGVDTDGSRSAADSYVRPRLPQTWPSPRPLYG